MAFGQQGTGFRNQVLQALIAGTTIINSKGMFTYAPTRAAGNLVASTGIGTPGTDKFGNAYLAGDTVYFGSGGSFVALSLQQGTVSWWTAATEAGPWVNVTAVGLLVLAGNTYLDTAGNVAINNSEIWIAPSGDTTGVHDTNNIVAMLGTFFTIHLLPGLWYIISGNINVGLQQHIFGAGRGATQIRVVDNALPGFKPGINIENSGTYSSFFNAGIHHMLFDGTGSVKSNCVMFGDIAGIELEKLSINNFPQGTGLYGNNRNHWTEQLKGEAWIQNCFNAMALDANGGTNSYDRMHFTMWVGLQDTQSAVRLIGGTGLAGDVGIQIAEGVLRIFGNFQNGNTGGGALMTFDPIVTKQRNVLSMQLDIGVEIQGSGTANPRTFNFHNAAPTDTVQQCYGTMFFFGPWTASNNNGHFGYNGKIFGDFSLQTKMYTPDVTLVTPNAPLAGTVSFENPALNGKVFVKFAISVPAGQTMGAGFTIANVSTFPFFLATDNTIITLWVNGGGFNQGTSVIISNTGVVANNGPAIAAVGSAAFIYGQAIYSNSY